MTHYRNGQDDAPWASTRHPGQDAAPRGTLGKTMLPMSHWVKLRVSARGDPLLFTTKVFFPGSPPPPPPPLATIQEAELELAEEAPPQIPHLQMKVKAA